MRGIIPKVGRNVENTKNFVTFGRVSGTTPPKNTRVSVCCRGSRDSNSGILVNKYLVHAYGQYRSLVAK